MFNCNATSPVTVVELQSLPASTISPLGSLDICLVGSVTLQANIGTGFTYQWLKSGDPIIGATNSIYLAVQAKTYKVIVTDSHGCSKTSKGVKVTKSCKVENGFGEEAKDLLTIYPNPTDGNFTVDLKMNSDIHGKATIQVLNTIGQVIYEKSLVVENGSFIDEINLGINPTNEIYLVRVIIDDKTFSREIVYQE